MVNKINMQRIIFGLICVFCTTAFECAYANPGLITSETVRLISSTLRTQRRELVNDEVTMIVTGVRYIFLEYDDFSNLNNDTIWGAIGMNPDNPYGGKYELSVDPTNSRQFIVSITGLSKMDCEYFVAKEWPDSVNYVESDKDKTGVVGSCNAPDGENVVKITYGE